MKNIVLFCVLACLGLQAAEVDHFSKYLDKIPSSTSVVNREINENIEAAIYEANRESSCVSEKLYEEMQIYFSNHIKGGKFIDFLHHLPDSRLKKVSKENSIYRDWRFFNGLIMAISDEKETDFTNVPMLRLDEVELGVDKFEHFFGTGLYLYKKHYMDGKSLRKIYKKNIFRERNFLGGRWYATGIFSFGDLSANFNGMRFWYHVLNNGKDVLGQKLGPYVICEKGKWKKVKNVDIRDYVDHSFDEKINCSMMPTKGGARKANEELAELSKRDGIKYSCPMDSGKFKALVKKYGEHAPYLLNKQGIIRIPFGFSFDNFGLQSSRETAKKKKPRFGHPGKRH